MQNQYSPEVIRQMINEFVKPYLPLVDEVLDDVAPALDKVFSRLMQYTREQTVKSIRYYESQGMDRKDAILLTINGNVALAEVVKNAGNKQKRY